MNIVHWSNNNEEVFVSFQDRSRSITIHIQTFNKLTTNRRWILQLWSREHISNPIYQFNIRNHIATNNNEDHD